MRSSTPLVNTSTSTSALSVWTTATMSPRATVSPGCLSHCSERARAHVGAERGHHELGHQIAISLTTGGDPLGARQRRVLEVLRVRDRHLGAADALHRPVEQVEAVLHDLRADLAGQAARPPALVDDHDPVRLRERGEDRVHVERTQRAQVDDLRLDPVPAELLGRREALPERAAVGDEGDVLALAAHDRVRDVDRARLLVHLVLERVERRVLEDEHGSGSSSAASSMPRASSTVAGARALDAGDVRVPDLQAVRVLGGQLAPAARRHAHDQRHAHLPARHVAQRRRVVHDLVEREQAEVDRHHLDDRAHAAERRADPRADEADSESGVLRTRSGPNSSSRPRLTANAPP